MRKFYFKYPPGYFNDGMILWEGEGGGGGSSSSTEDEPSRRRDPVVTAAKYNSDVNAMARHINDLEDDNYKLRRDKRDLNTQVTELSKKTPEGSVVLTKEQAAQWEAYQKLGKPEEIEKIKQDNLSLQKDVADSKRSVLLNDIAATVEPGVRLDAQVLRDLDSRSESLGLEYEKREVTENDEKVEKWFVKYKEESNGTSTQKEATVLEFYKQKYPKYMASLLDATALEAPGTFYPDQPPVGGTPPQAATIADTLFTDRYARPQQQKAA